MRRLTMKRFVQLVLAATLLAGIPVVAQFAGA